MKKRANKGSAGSRASANCDINGEWLKFQLEILSVVLPRITKIITDNHDDEALGGISDNDDAAERNVLLENTKGTAAHAPRQARYPFCSLLSIL